MGKGRIGESEGQVRVALACNDYRNGSFQGWCDSISIGEIELEGPRTTVRELSPTSLRVGRHKYRMQGSREWVGNWCWNEYELDPGEWVRLVKNLRNRDWRCVAGPSAFFASFNAKARAK